MTTISCVYLEHSIKQSCGWVKIAEYVCDDKAHAAKVEQQIRAMYPNDESRFNVRGQD